MFLLTSIGNKINDSVLIYKVYIIEPSISGKSYDLET